MKVSPYLATSHRGSALIVVLWSVLLLAFAVSMAAERAFLLVGDTSIRSKRFQAGWLADSALATLNQVLKEEQRKHLEGGGEEKAARRPLDLARFQRQWNSEPVALGGGLYHVEIYDEQGRLHWLKTPASVWRRFFQTAGLETEVVDAWMDALADWQDSNENRALHGAETADYEACSKDKRRAKNAPITDPGELVWVMGGARMLEVRLTMDTLGRTGDLLPLTTLYGDGKINLNSAPAVLIAAALNLPLERAQEVVRRREGADGVEGTADDRFLDGIPAGIVTAGDTTPEGQATPATTVTTVSSYFRVRGVGEFQGQRVVKEALAVKNKNGLRLLEDPRVVGEGSVPPQEARL